MRAVSSGRCPPQSLVCRDGRVLGFRALRFNGEAVSLLTDRGLLRVPYRELAEIAMQPMDPWEAYYRQLAATDPDLEAGLVRLVTGGGMVLTAPTSRVEPFRGEAEPAASTIRIQPGWSGTPIALAWSAVRQEVAGGRQRCAAFVAGAGADHARRPVGRQLEVADRP